MRDNPSVVGHSTSTASMLLMLFIGLKLVGVIDWSWLWVLSPLWVPVVVVVAGIVLAVVVAVVIGACGLAFGLWKGDI